MAMGLVSVPEPEWFEIDTLYQSELAERSRLLTSHHAEVFGAEPGTEPARTETLAMMIEHLARVYPGWFERDDSLSARERRQVKGERRSRAAGAHAGGRTAIDALDFL